MASTLNQSLLLALWVWASAASLRSIDGLPMSARHELWMLQYGRVYKNQAEREHRFQIFKENVEYIDSANTRASDRKYFLGVNQFADITKEELKASRNGFNFKKAGHAAANATENFRYGNVSDVPSAMDWRAKGAVTPIKDQGQCGCCWAFSAVASTEGINQITTGKLVSLSEQEVVSCDVNGQDQGCDGGLADGAFQFIIDNGGLTTEANYPYKGTDGTCNTSISASSAASISGYEDVPTNSESSLLSAAANQPVSVAIDAGGSDFQFYSTGVFTGRCGTELDHAVTVVGYGAASDGTKYWVVKNSWGTEWGEKGYIRMQRDVGAAEGLCGIAMQASYPTA